jgi:hypothetical protein
MPNKGKSKKKKSPNGNGNGKPKSNGAASTAGRKSATTAAKARHVHETCSITNPFCLAARGARRPDGLSQATLPFQVRGAIPVTTDATGAAFLAVVPGLGVYGTLTATLAAGTWTTAAALTQLPGSAFLVTNASFLRIVSMGAVFRSTVSMTDCQGTLLHAVRTAGTVAQTIPALNMNNVEVQMGSMKTGQEYTWIAKPLGASAHAFVERATAVTSTMGDWKWTQCYFEVSGGPASVAVGVVEVVVNVELQLGSTAISTTGLGGVPLGSKPANPVAVRGQQQVQSTIPSIIMGGVQAVEQAVTSKATSVISDIVSGVEDFGLALLGF